MDLRPGIRVHKDQHLAPGIDLADSNAQVVDLLSAVDRAPAITTRVEMFFLSEFRGSDATDRLTSSITLSEGSLSSSVTKMIS